MSRIAGRLGEAPGNAPWACDRPPPIVVEPPGVMPPTMPAFRAGAGPINVSLLAGLIGATGKFKDDEVLNVTNPT